MTVAVTDACIFIDLFLLDLHEAFFTLPLSMHTTLEVFEELDEHQKFVLSAQHERGLLTIHILTEHQRIEAAKGGYPRSLSEADKTVLHFAIVNGAMVLSSDKVLRNCAKRLNLKYHGILWIIEQLVKNGRLEKSEGITALDQLLRINPTMPGSKEVMKKVGELKRSWEGEE